MGPTGVSTNSNGGPTTPRLALSSAKGAMVFVGIFLAVLMGGLDALIVSTALPTIATDLKQANGVAFVVSAYLIASTVSIPVFARLSDTLSRRNVFVMGLAIFVVGSASAGLSQNLSELIAFRAVQGFGIGGLFPVAIAMVAVLFAPETRARVTGLLAAAAGISIVIGPLVGSYILDTTTWRWIFYVNLPIGVAGVAILSLAVGPLRPTGARGRFDLVGGLSLSAWVGALMFALVQVSDAGWAWSDPRVVALLVAAAVVCGVFLWWELRTAQPLVPLRLLRHRVIGPASGASLFTGLVFSAAATFLSVFVGIVLLHGGPNASDDVRDMLYFFAIPMVIAAAVSAPLLERVSYRALIVPGLAVAAVSSVFLTTLSTSTPLWTFTFGFLPTGGLIAPLVPMGFGSGLALGGLTIAVQSEAPLEQVGSAVGLVRFFQSLGAAVGLSLLTAFQAWRLNALVAAAGTPAEVARAISTSYDEVFLGLTFAVTAAAICAGFLRGRLAPKVAGTRALAGSAPSTVPTRAIEPAAVAALPADPTAGGLVEREKDS